MSQGMVILRHKAEVAFFCEDREYQGVQSMKIGTAILGVLLIGGCNSERAFGAYNWSTHTWSTPEGIKVEDRVSRKLIDPKTALKFDYLGEMYYFENKFDLEMFYRDPGAYNYHGYDPNYAGGP